MLLVIDITKMLFISESETRQVQGPKTKDKFK